MSPAAIAAIVMGFLLLTRNGTAAPAPPPRTAAPAAGGVAGPGGTQITIPGLGSYTNVPGAGVSITLDPRLFGGGAAPQPEPSYYAGIAAPQLSSGYIPEAQMDAPITLQPPTWPWPPYTSAGYREAI